MALDYNSDVDFPDQDSAYMNTLEVDYAEEFAARKSWLIDSLLIEYDLDVLSVPSNGKIVEIGIWKGHVYEKLKTKYTAERCIGFDIHDYLNNDDSSVVIGDFRTINSSYDQDVALVYNGCGGWDTNSSSKQAGLDYAYRNLVSGGYYIDLAFFWQEPHIPDMTQYPDFIDATGESDIFKIYRKT